MAHEIDFSANGVAAMAYTGDAPWHKLGTKVEDTAGMLSSDFLKLAGCDWTVALESIFTRSE